MWWLLLVVACGFLQSVVKSDDTSDSSVQRSEHISVVPRPTARQLQWAEMEMAALVHFNMASTHNCSDPDNFAPDKLDVDQWVESFRAFGAREAVLVAKHACGFCTWPSNATLPDGTRYPYSTAHSTWRRGAGDVVGEFLAAVTKAGLGVGYYYSLHQLGSHIMDKYNFSAGQVRAIETQQLTELWGQYGNAGNLSEVWFDGGIDDSIRPTIRSMLKKFQPSAMAFNSCGGTGFFPGKGGGSSNCVTPNAIRDTGTEAGAVGNPNWSTQNFSDGREIFVPSESDTTLQLTDSWFYDAADGLRSLAELQDVYHQTVGHNSLLMMDFSPTAEGLISPTHAARYAEFGEWQRGCYDVGSKGMVGLVEHARGSEEAGSTQLLTLDKPSLIDRVVVREDQTNGQVIRRWEVQAQLSHDSNSSKANAWTRIANGTSMGNKWIVLLQRNLTVSAIRTVATGTALGTTARIRSTSAHLCSRAKSNASCSIRQDWAADGVGNSTNRNGDAKTIAECCDACTKTKGCALFVAKPNAIDGHGCVLWSATGVGGQVIKGAVTGSPR
eukprot:COSAG02_NODE_1277_length_13502_cov_14.551593_14_plen_554_part_00